MPYPATSQNLANAICKLVAVDTLPAVIGNGILLNLLQRDFEPHEAKAGGEVVLYRPTLEPRYASLLVYAHQFTIPDVTKVIAVPDLLRLYMQPAVCALVEDIETCIGNALQSPNEDSFVESREAFSDLLFPPRPPELCSLANSQHYIVGPPAFYANVRHDLRAAQEYRSPAEAGLAALIDGPFLRIHDTFVFRSPFVGPHFAWSFVRPAATLALRRLPRDLSTGPCEYAELGNLGLRVRMLYVPNTLQQTFEISVLCGATTMYPEYLSRIDVNKPLVDEL